MFTMFTGATTFSASVTEGQTVNYTHYRQKNLTESPSTRCPTGLSVSLRSSTSYKKGSYNVGIVILR